MKLSGDPLEFIKRCIFDKRVFWTYHVNMRLRDRAITRRMVVESPGNFEIIESYPEDKYMPSYLVYSRYDETIFHVLFAIDEPNNNVRVVTAYIPDPSRWNADFKRRLK